ncbi:hypothetical protein GUITHDRAFT_132135 [Guillardia theta CCMP2712]|uniref:Uncharacterized protein n=2 Tax=Guillardia theta TaxID=55529 RepID=L1K0N5_GUITC|nr:hypothetical protein GUITHDRAFT_132135 [Guillardia theta CCMP2712]EKX54391.1 hypothetical protein GUITHDRAFT_132135 [Guillardia theta CCMP2712]|eukprot:XP_005841371.1 hypothetical protein GUITHDRAFT_132135 [Guillardia theta CCMP2712]
MKRSPSFLLLLLLSCGKKSCCYSSSLASVQQQQQDQEFSVQMLLAQPLSCSSLGYRQAEGGRFRLRFLARCHYRRQEESKLVMEAFVNAAFLFSEQVELCRGGSGRFHPHEMTRVVNWSSVFAGRERHVLMVKVWHGPTLLAQDFVQFSGYDCLLWQTSFPPARWSSAGRVVLFENATAKEVFSDGRRIEMWISSGGGGGGGLTRVNVSVWELKRRRCMYIALAAPFVLDATFLQREEEDEEQEEHREGQGILSPLKASLDLCGFEPEHLSYPLSVFVLSVSCSPNCTRRARSHLDELRKSALVEDSNLLADFSLWIRTRCPWREKACRGDERGIWAMRGRRVSGYTWRSTTTLPLLAMYRLDEEEEKWEEAGRVGWSQLVYGQSMVWQLWGNKLKQAVLGVQHFLSPLVSDTNEMFEWEPLTCRLLPLHVIARRFLNLTPEKKQEVGAQHQHQHQQQGQRLDGEEEEEGRIVRIGLAGTSRVRGVFYALQEAITGRKVWREKKLNPFSYQDPRSGLFLDYFPLQGSEFHQFFHQKGIRNDKEVLVMSVGLYEVLWGQYHLLEECLYHFFSTLHPPCHNSSTLLVFKTEEAAPAKREDQLELWQAKVQLVNSIGRRLARSFGVVLLDAHLLSLSRSDATQDGSHYWRFHMLDADELKKFSMVDLGNETVDPGGEEEKDLSLLRGSHIYFYGVGETRQLAALLVSWLQHNRSMPVLADGFDAAACKGRANVSWRPLTPSSHFDFPVEQHDIHILHPYDPGSLHEAAMAHLLQRFASGQSDVIWHRRPPASDRMLESDHMGTYKMLFAPPVLRLSPQLASSSVSLAPSTYILVTRSSALALQPECESNGFT